MFGHEPDAVLKDIAVMLKAHAELKLEIAGHADNTGSDEPMTRAAAPTIDGTCLPSLLTASRKLGVDPAQPSSASGLEEIDGLGMLVLRNVDGILAVYRVRNDGKLEALKRGPASLEDE